MLTYQIVCKKEKRPTEKCCTFYKINCRIVVIPDDSSKMLLYYISSAKKASLISLSSHPLTEFTLANISFWDTTNIMHREQNWFQKSSKIFQMYLCFLYAFFKSEKSTLNRFLAWRKGIQICFKWNLDIS